MKNTIVESNRYNNNEYLNVNTTWHAEDSFWKARQIKKILSNNNIEPKRVCEVGCGAGEILVSLEKTTEIKELHGYEVSSDAFEKCKNKH